MEENISNKADGKKSNQEEVNKVNQEASEKNPAEQKAGAKNEPIQDKEGKGTSKSEVGKEEAKATPGGSDGNVKDESEKIQEDPTKFNINPSVSENFSGLLAFLKSTVSFQKKSPIY